MSRNSVEIIELQISRLKNRLAQTIARESAAARKLKSRQAIILGAWLMTNKPEIASAIAQKCLKRDQDRAAFGLPPLTEASDGPSPAPQVDIPTD